MIISGDSVTLNWTKEGNKIFKAYTIYRLDSIDFTTFVVGTNINTFTDTAVPRSSYIQYYIGIFYSFGNNIYRNPQFYVRPEIKTLFINPFDIQFDNDNNLIYLFEKK